MKRQGILVSLFVCLAHMTGLCFVSHSPPILETKNRQLETDSYDITAGAIPKPTLQRTAQNTFDAADRLVSSSVRYGQGADSTPHITETFLYDGNGALTNWVSNTNMLSFSYDALGQVAKVAQTFLSAFSYDALGNRIIMGDSLFIPDHSDSLKRPLMECDSNGNILRYYIWGDNRLLGFIEGNTLTVAHCDDFGSVIALTDLSGNVFYTANYGPHGEDWGSVGVNPTPFAWLGGYGVQYLETATPLRLFLTRHRLYSATLNRFLSSDPLGLEGGLNLYQYGEGNPLVYIDPFGLKAQNTQSSERGFFGNVLAGATQGDFADNTGWGGVVGQVGVGLIPVVGQIADARDIAANAVNFWNEPSWGAAAGVAGAAVGLVPGVGDAAKGLVKGGKTAVKEAGQAVAKNIDVAAKGISSVPPKATDVLTQVQKTGVSPSGYKGGGAFANDGRNGTQLLPKSNASGAAITYKEFDVNPLQNGVNRGTERIVIGSDGKAYFTSDHYKTFTPMQ